MLQCIENELKKSGRKISDENKDQAEKILIEAIETYLWKEIGPLTIGLANHKISALLYPEQATPALQQARDILISARLMDKDLAHWLVCKTKKIDETTHYSADNFFARSFRDGLPPIIEPISTLAPPPPSPPMPIYPNNSSTFHRSAPKRSVTAPLAASSDNPDENADGHTGHSVPTTSTEIAQLMAMQKEQGLMLAKLLSIVTKQQGSSENSIPPTPSCS
jgi:hypothetical protein